MSKVGHNIWLGAEGWRGGGGVAGAKGCPDSLEQNRSLGECMQWRRAIMTPLNNLCSQLDLPENGLIIETLPLSIIDFPTHDICDCSP